MPHQSALADPALTFAIALAAGVVAQAVAHHLRVPGIVVFLLSGVLLGPDLLGVVQPETLGHGLEMLVGLAVAVILFEGGLNLNLHRLRREAKTIRRLITIGAVITAAGGAVGARFFMGWDWRLSILFGTLVIVTGPTVITPLLRRIRVNRTLSTVLEAEGVLIDPVGAIIAVVALEIAVGAGGTDAAVDLLGIPTRLIVGAVVGVVGGLVIALLLRNDRIVPEGIENIFTLSLVLALFEISNAILPESGIMTAAVAGLVVGNMKTRLDRELREFKEQLTIMLVGLLFVLLAADVRLADVYSLGWAGVSTILFLMFVVRPIDVSISAAGSTLTVRERLFMGWLSPRGIVAAAVASLFAQRLVEEGIEGGIELRALVFLVIAVTVVVQGLTGGVVASFLGVRRQVDNGYVVVGASPVGRALAAALRVGGNDVVLIDSNARAARAAEGEGFTVIYGNANEERALIRADIEGRKGFCAVTPNPDANLLIAHGAKDASKRLNTYVTLARGRSGARARRVKRDGHSVLFGIAIEMGQWNHQLHQGDAGIQRWRYVGIEEDGVVDIQARFSSTVRLLPLTIMRGGRTDPVDQDTVVRTGDEVVFLLMLAQDGDVESLLRVAGWERVQADVADEMPVATTGAMA